MKKAVATLVGSLIVASFAGGISRHASAGILDKLKGTKQALKHAGDGLKHAGDGLKTARQQSAQQAQQQTLSSDYCPPQSTVCDHHVLDKMVACQSKMAGRLEQLAADRLEKKLAVSSNLNAKERAVWQADIGALRDVGYEHPYQPPDPKSPHQYTDGLTKDEYTAIQTTYARYRQQVFIDCEQEVPNGLSSPEDTQKYIASLRAKMPKAMDISTIPLEALPSPFPKSEAEIAKEREAADAARRAKLQQLTAKCSGGANSLRMEITADRLQQKLDNSQGLSAKERADFVADIKATRDAAAEGLSQPKPVDPTNPYRYVTRLTLDDQMAINTELQNRYTAQLQKCTQQ